MILSAAPNDRGFWQAQQHSRQTFWTGNTGTTITAEDLFYNMGTRKRAMNGRDEFNKVAHVITCYAVHNTGIAFSLKKSGKYMKEFDCATK